MTSIQKTIGGCTPRPDPPILAPDAPVSRAISALLQTGHTAVLVMKGDALVGIFTERDLLHRVAALRRDPESTPMSAVMTRDPEVLRAADCVTYAINRMAVGGFSNIPVVEESGAPTGLLGVREVMAHLSEVFDELEQPGGSNAAWIDMGGG